MKIAVTGAHGYAGSEIADKLESLGYEVVELVRNPNLNSKRTQIKFDLGRAISPLEFKNLNITTLVHVAYDFKQTQWADIHKINFEGSVKLFEAFLNGGGQTGIYISTVSAFNSCKSMYGRVKRLTEHEALSRGFWVVRPGLIRGGKPGGIVGTMLGLVKKLPVVPIIGYGLKSLYPVRADELSNLIAHLVVKNPTNTTDALVVAAHREALSLDDVVREMSREQNLKKRILLPVPWRPVWFLLSTLEKAGISTGLRSDSVISLMNQDPDPPFRDTSTLFAEPENRTSQNL